MEAVGAGDRRAISDLYDRHAASMLGLAMRILRDRSDAEDLVHDVFLEAWKRSTSYSAQQGSLRNWLLTRVRSRAIDRLRSLNVVRRHAHMERVTRQDDPAAAQTDDASTMPDGRRARAAVAALPEPQRVVLELAYFEGLSCAEIAQRCETPLGTVKSRLLAGMRSLRRRFDDQEAVT